jgi:phage head maturation protease
MKFKTMPATVTQKADDGIFEAVVSVFNNRDHGGDIVRPGAFKNSLEHWSKADAPIPVYWSHRLDDPNMNIGEVIDAEELEGGSKSIPTWANNWVQENGGLYIKGQLDDFGMGAQVRHLMKRRRVKQFSFTYDVINEQRSKDDTANELLDVFLHEVGPTPLGMNPLTELISAKHTPPPIDDPPPDSSTSTTYRPSGAVFLRRKLADLAELTARSRENEGNNA